MTEQQSNPETAVARPEMAEIAAPAISTIRVAVAGEVEIVEQETVLPAIMQYTITRMGQTRVMVTSDGYDYLNRTMGVQFYRPKYVNDEKGNKVPNPIHRPDYIYLRLVGVWYNDLGQMVSYEEDVEVDFKLTYHDVRINSKSAKVKTDEQGFPMFSADNSPIVMLSAEDELKALRALSQLRTFGLRYAQTVAKTRILKVASGIKTLPGTQARNIRIKTYGFRDALTPQERQKEAQRATTAMYGPSDVVTDEPDEDGDQAAKVIEEIVREVEDSDDVEATEQTLVQRHIEADEESAARDAAADTGEAVVLEAAPENAKNISPIDPEPSEAGGLSLGFDPGPKRASRGKAAEPATS